MQRTTAAWVRGNGSSPSIRRAAVLTRSAIRPGARNCSSVGSMRKRSAGDCAAAASRSSRSTCAPSSSHCRMDSLTSHIPETFLRNRTVPSTPPSLVKPARRASSVATAAGSSRPISDQVPEEMKATGLVPGAAGTASTAEAVSWEPIATTGTSPVPSSRPSSGRTVPRRSPGEISGASSSRSIPAASSSSEFQPPSRPSIPVLDALVLSLRRTPVSRCPIRSGTISRVLPGGRSAARSSAASWYRVLKGCCAMPVSANCRWRETRSATRSATPSVRESR